MGADGSPIMFGGLIVFLLLGFPVAFSLGACEVKKYEPAICVAAMNDADPGWPRRPGCQRTSPVWRRTGAVPSIGRR